MIERDVYKFYVVVVHYGDPGITDKCIKSILRQKEYIEELVVSDNSGNYLPMQGTENLIKVIDNQRNIGYAAAINKGLEYGRELNAEYYLLLNNDVILEDDFFKNICQEIGNDKLFIASPRIHYLQDKKIIWYNGGYIDYLKFEGVHKDIDRYSSECTIPEIKQEVTFISGAVFIITLDVIEKIGMIDEKYFLYYEDLDFSLTALRNGIKLLYIPQAVAYHNVSSNTKQMDSFLNFKKEIYYYRIRNKLLILSKYGKELYRLSGIFYLSIKILKYFMLFILVGKFSYIKLIFRGIFDAFSLDK